MPSRRARAGHRRGDAEYVALALALAARGRGRTSPNPMVGAVLVRRGRVVGTGYHRRAGEDHAEVIALRRAGARARGATLYVNLEPCSHHGRTPPCVDALLRAGVRRVVASMVDPNPRVRGRGFRALRQAGVEVREGVLRREARVLNEAYRKFIATGRPFVVLKAGISLDGRLAARGGASRWITSAASRAEGRRMRAAHDAVAVGVGTVLADDPGLLPPAGAPRRPGFLRVVLDSRLRTPLTSRLVRSARRSRVRIYATAAAPARRATALRARGVEVVTVGSRGKRLDLEAVLDHLAGGETTSLLVEGGGEVHAAFVERSLADRLVLFVAPLLLGGRLAVPLLGGHGAPSPARGWRVRQPSWRLVGPDLVVEGYLRRRRG